MPEIIVNDNQSINKLVEYANARNKSRGIMATGVYPNSVAAMAAYNELLLWLEANPDYADLHATSTAAVTAYITQMRQAMQTIITIMESIERAYPGMFGIQLPVEEQPV